MNKLTRSLLSGASFAVLAVGLPQAADANVVTGTGPGQTVGVGGDLTLNGTFDWVGLLGDRGGDVILNGKIDNGACTVGGTFCFGLAFYPGVQVTGDFINNGTISVSGVYTGKQEVDAILVGFDGVSGATVSGTFALDGGVINMAIGGSPNQVAGIALESDTAANVTIDPGKIAINWHGNDGASVGNNGEGVLTCGESATGTNCVSGAEGTTHINPKVPDTHTCVNVSTPDNFFPIGGEGNFPEGFLPGEFGPPPAVVLGGFDPLSYQNQGGINPNAALQMAADPKVYGIVDFYGDPHTLNVTNIGMGIGVSLTAAVQTLGVYGIYATNTAGGVGNVSLNVKATTAAANIVVAARVNAILGTVAAQGLDLRADANGATSASVNVTNSANISAFAHAGTCTTGGFCWGLGQEDAFATGVLGIAKSATFATVNVVNNGNIVASAQVTGGSNFFWFGTGNHANAAGVVEFASTATVANLNLTNNAGGVVSAKAFATGTSVMTANAVGVLQSAFIVSTANLTVKNGGTINAFASASGSGFAGVSGASIHANALGIAQTAVTLVGSANLSVSNQAGGVINVTANAHAFNAGVALASANATGITQFGIGFISSAHNVVHNTGTLNVHANALATSATVAVALANAIGVNQVAIATSVARNDVHNNGVMNIGASAGAGAVTSFAGGATVAVASAHVVFGINQVAIAFSTANNHLTNGPTTLGAGGTINIGAGALAVGTTVAVANAIIGTSVFGFSVAAIQQFALASTFASNTLTNNGNINITAGAAAFASTVAVAVASINNAAIGQNAIALSGGKTASALNTLNNSGDIEVHASALAVAFHTTLGAFTGTAVAVAVADAAINQTAFVLAGGHASNVYNNSGTLDVGAGAGAIGGAVAIAIATASGISQHAGTGWTNENHLFNGTVVTATGSAPALIHVHATAGALAISGIAVANASAQGILQSAIASGGATSTASGTLVNQGIIDVTAKAGADGLVLGFAHASALGIFQGAFSASLALVTLTNGLTVNSGPAIINVSANASAHGLTTSGGGHLVNAFDVAFATVGNAKTAAISQIATGNGNSALASANLSNQGVIDLKAHANATALGSALAIGQVNGIFQGAFGAGTANVGLFNATGATISETASAHALATGAFGGAGAGALAVGISQVASVFLTNGTQAHVNLTNDGLINVVAKASATASAIAVAQAFAIGISQFAFAGSLGGTGTVANNHLFNTGNIHVSGNAHASAFSIAAATALVFGISQAAFASSNTNSLASDLLVNKGTITVEAHAVASASGLGVAVALPIYGVFQSASSADFVTAAFINGTTTGPTPDVAATLHVSGTAFAGGFFALAVAASERGVSQTVNADGFTSSLALASVINHGHITVNATAVALGGASASAIAVDAGVFQGAHHAQGFTTLSGIFGATAQLYNDGEINVTASAFAAAANAFAFASAFGIGQTASASTPVLWGTLARDNLTNDNLIHVSANASASGFLFGGKASALANAFGVSQTASSAWNAVNTVINNATIEPFAHAWAEGWTSAVAVAAAGGVFQSATGIGLPLSLANNLLVNNGLILATAIATAKAGTSAFAAAGAFGVTQSALNAAFANNFLFNGGLINASAHASAHGAFATAVAFARGVSQSATVISALVAPTGTVLAGVAADFLHNSGTINAVATAFAKGGAVSVSAHASGINQWAGGSSIWAAGAHITNTAGASLNVAAHATGIGYARAGGVTGTPVIAGATGINQGVWSTTTLGGGAPALALGVGVTNAGVIHVEATAIATGGIWAAASASASGIWQRASNALVAGAAVFNTGNLTVLANASAKTTTDAFGAVAVAFAVGVTQGVSATATSGLALATVINKGTIVVDANAFASGPFAFGFASAAAVGVTQGLFGFFASEHFHNTGLLDVHAGAVAQGSTSNFAFAFAQGVNVNGGPSSFLSLDAINDGTIHVEADAGNGGSPGTGTAIAGGIFASDGFASGVVFGTIANHAKLSVTANAAGASFGVASAFGIAVAANNFAPPTVLATALISNTGSLYVRAIVGSTGGSPRATGILVTANGAPTGVGTGHIVNNSGTIYAGISFDSGATFLRGTAINTFFAPNAMQIDWMGSVATGKIYGNVFISTDDTIIVSDGKTCFNGVINDPSLIIPNSPFPGTLASAVGVLSILASGTLVMVNDPVQGPAAAYVSTYNQSGTLVLELRGQDHTPAANSLGKIVVSVSANLGGALVVVPYAGLYTNAAYTVASGPVGGLNGTWTNVYVGSTAGEHSVLLHGSVSNNGTVAIFNLTRTAFNAVPGLTHNEQHVGLGMQHSYSTSMTGPYADMIAKLFLQDSNAGYADALFQLSGVEYGQQALASLASVRMLNDTIGTHLQVISSGGSDHVGQLISGVSPAAGGTGIGKGNIWVSAYGSWGHADASAASGSRNDYTDHGIFGGVDFDMDPQTKVGLVVGETSGQSRFKEASLNQGNFNGWHLGMYGRYDADPWYVQGVAAYAIYGNDMTRNISINPSLDGACCAFPFGEASAHFGGTAKSSYDSHVLSLHGEAGWNWDTGSAVDLTPFLAVSWMRATSDPFTEHGLPGADLKVGDASADSFATQLGIRLTTDWQISEHMMLSPVVRLAWEHQWDGTLWSVDASFADAPPNSNFTVNGRGYSRDFANVGLGLSANISGRVEAVLGYQGRWSSDEKENSVLGRVNVHW